MQQEIKQTPVISKDLAEGKQSKGGVNKKPRSFPPPLTFKHLSKRK